MSLKHNLFKDNSGVTLIELLLALFLFALITIIIVSTLVMGMNSTKNVQKDVSLHDEANYIMTQLVNVIYEGKEIVEKNTSIKGLSRSIEVSRYYEEKVIEVDLEKDQVLIDGVRVHSPATNVLSEDSGFKKVESKSEDSYFKKVIRIVLVVQDAATEKELKLTREISYINGEDEEGSGS